MHALLSALLWLGQVSAPVSMTPIPVQREIHHRVVLENAMVKVLSVRLPAGEVMSLHGHPVDHLAVVIEGAKLRNEVEGQAPVEHYTGDPGTVIFLPAGPPHLQANIDTHAAWWVGVELVGFPGAAVGPSIRVGPHYQSALDGPRVQAANLVLAPGERVDRFPFPPPFLQISITPGDLEVTREHGTARTTLYAGAPTWENERIRTIINRGDRPLQLVFVRIK